MQRTWTLLLATLLAAGALAGCATNDGGSGGDDKRLKVGTEAKYPPFEDLVDGKIVGFDIDVFDEVAKRAGYTVEYQNAAFDDIIPSVQNGQFDVGVSAFTINDARKQQVDFTVPYYDNDLLVATRASESGIGSEADLKPDSVRVCTQAGTTSEDWLRSKGYDNDTMTLLPDFPSCGASLTRGDVRAILIDRAAVRDLVAKSNGQLKEGFIIPLGEQFGFAVQKGRGELLGDLNEAINAMKADGTLRQLMDKWKV